MSTPAARRGSPVVAVGAALVVLLGGSAGTAAAQGVDDLADQWLPRSDGAEWTYAWSNNVYSPTPRVERYRLLARNGVTFRLRWDEVDPASAGSATAGTMDFQHTDGGLMNLNYQSTPPPASSPVLCPAAAECGNSLSGALHLVVWGSRSPALAEPLLRGARWSAQGGAGNDVVSDNRYAGRSKVTVPAFPAGVEAAKVESRITQAGAIGDPFGSGIRTVWWVRGVGPVKLELRHASGEVSRVELRSTSLTPKAPPTDVNLLPLARGGQATFRWRNDRHMRKWSRQRFDVAQASNGTAQVNVKHLSGPIRVAGTYLLSTRQSGVTLVSGATQAATRASFPPLGPSGAAAADRNHFFTPYDLMVYGFNPIIPIDPATGTTWRSSREARDWKLFGVTGVSKVTGKRTIETALGRLRTTVVRSTLTQRRHRFGSGTRTSWFAAGKGLVRLVFRHADGSTSTVERIR